MSDKRKNHIDSLALYLRRQKLSEPLGRKKYLPGYPLHPMTREKLIDYGFDPSHADCEQKQMFDLSFGTLMEKSFWKQGRFMLTWDVEHNQWSIRNFPICRN